MHRILSLIVAGTSLLLPSAGNAGSWWESGSAGPDFTYDLRIESVPSGAEVCTTPADSYEESTVIGRTPMALPVSLRWERVYKEHIWKALHVDCAGQVCEDEYSRDDGSHTLYLNFMLRAPGYADTNIIVHLATLMKSDVVWTNLQPPAYPRVVRATLRPVGGAARSGSSSGLRTVMIAAGSAGQVDVGTVSVYANLPYATVIVNGQPVGAPPVRLLLDAAMHRIEVSEPGYQTQGKDVDVTPGSNVSLRFNLVPE